MKIVIKNDQENYGLISKLLHWLIALATFGLFGLGLWMTDLGYYDEWYQKAPKLHEGIGVFLFIFLIIRIVWRWISPLPEPVSTLKKWERTGSHFAHSLLNLLLLVITISGYLIITAKGEPVHVFDLFIVPATNLNDIFYLEGLANQEDLAGEIHYYVAWGLIVLAGIHALAAFKHHFIDKDRTLDRMLGRK